MSQKLQKFITILILLSFILHFNPGQAKGIDLSNSSGHVPDSTGVERARIAWKDAYQLNRLELLQPVFGSYPDPSFPDCGDFQDFQPIPTNGAMDFEFFRIDDHAYLAVANAYNDSTNNIDSKIYRWDGNTFVEFQSIPTSGAADWEFFTIGTDVYLTVANYQNGSTTNIDSEIYHWNGSSFVSYLPIPTLGAQDWNFFTIGSDHYLAVANSFNGSTYNIDSKIYKWTGSTFTETQSINTSSAFDWQSFTVGSDVFLAVANNYNGSTHNIDSKIYRWNGSKFAEFQSIPTKGARDWESFKIGSEYYLAVANAEEEGGIYSINSIIYHWDGTTFVPSQPIGTNYAQSFRYFDTTYGQHILAVANGNSYSKFYIWNGSSFIENQAYLTQFATDVEIFSIENNDYLALTNYYNGSSSSINSKILINQPCVNFIPLISR